MNRKKRRYKKNQTNWGKLIAVCVLSVSLALISFPVAARESTPEASSEQSDSSAMTANQAAVYASPSPSTESSESSSESPEVSPSPSTPGLLGYTVTYNMPGRSESETVAYGNFPLKVPENPELALAKFIGWYDADGNMVNPTAVLIRNDMVFTARFSREVSDILETDLHVPYINGYRDGTFKPDEGITRAEAAALFYNLLKNKDFEALSFADVPRNEWYSQAVGVMASLGIISGYEDGSFKPENKISRCEFAKIISSFSTLQSGGNSFWDVSSEHWALPYIVSAAQQGWISGYEDGSFKPDNGITRAEAVTMINRMLNRVPPDNITELTDARSFYDAFTDHWAYGQIEEAACSHTYTRHSDGGEGWGDYYKGDPIPSSYWVTDDGGSKIRYVDAETRKYVRGERYIDYRTYYFDYLGNLYNGFYYTSEGWTRYIQNGLVISDISNLGVTTGPYLIKVYKPSNYIIIFAKDSSGNYTVPVKSMLASCGYPTPTGTYHSPAKYRWLKMMGDTYAQWCTQIYGNYLIHSVPNWTYNNLDLEVYEYNNLGNTRSMGCIRVNCENAKWIYDNCATGTEIYISTETVGPLPKPAGIWIPSWHTWDPTDPTAHYMCERNGCH